MDHIESLIIASGKIKRADAQIPQLHADIRAFFDSCDYEIVSNINAKGTEEVWKYRLISKIPIDFAIRCGEILHNLRTPLDHLACAIAFKHSGGFKQTYFPFGADQDIFEHEVLRKAKKLPPEAVAMIRSLKPYKGGNDLLWYLHDLNRSDKHTPILATELGKQWDMRMLAGEEGGRVLVIGSRHGQHLVTGGYVPEIGDPASADDGMEFLTTTPGTKWHADIKPTFHIKFRNAESISGRTAVANLSHMCGLVKTILADFERVFFR